MPNKDSWSGIKNILGKIAPVLGNAIMPGIGGVAGSLLASVLGVSQSPDAIESALASASPEVLQKIKEMELKHEQVLLQIGVKMEEMRLQDISNARQMSSDLVKSTGKKDYNLYILAWTMIVGFFALNWFLMNNVLPKGQNEVVFMLFGSLATGFGQVLTYFFGSSKSSSDKTRLMAAKGGNE